ncbi:AIR synthase family protein [Vallitaleaceae bacterium 9-2]
MNIGKIPETVLKRSIFKQLQVKREEVLVGPGVGEDCGIVEIAPDEVIVLSTDPITGAAHEIGALAVHITLNDLAASGATPIGLLITLLLPDGYTEDALKVLMGEISQETQKHNVQIIGGHSEVTDAVIQPIVSVTGIGKIKKEQMLRQELVKPGMDIVMSKWAGLEGTTIIANAGEALLKEYYHSQLISRAKSFNQYLSIIKESQIAMKYKVYAMHDVTEGGIFGALWELGEKIDYGLTVDQSKIPVQQETVEICEYFDLNPYMLIGSGALLIVTEDGHKMVEDMKQAGVLATIIGRVDEGHHKRIKFEDTYRSIVPPKSDELYKALERCAQK